MFSMLPGIGATSEALTSHTRLRLWIDGQIFERQGHGGVSRIWLTYIPLLIDAGISVSVSVSTRAVSSSFVELADSLELETIWSDRRVDPISVFDAHWMRTRWLRRLAGQMPPGVFQSTWDSTVESGSRPEVMMVHDMIPEMTLRPRRSVFHAQVIASRKRALENAAAIVTVSRTTARDLVDVYPETAGRVHVVRHGPTIGEVEPVAIEDVMSARGLDLVPGEFYLFVGRREGYKNFGVVRELFNVSAQAAQRGLVVVGGSEPEPAELHPAISFVPYVTDPELVALYRSARALIYPSIYEGFGLPVLEAMSHGCPVVSSNADVLVEVGGEASIYFDPHSVDGLKAALKTADGLDNLEYSALVAANLSRFSWARSAGELAELYRSLS